MKQPNRKENPLHKYYVFLTDHGSPWIDACSVIVCYFFSKISDGQMTAASRSLYNITLYAPEQDAALQLCSHIFPIKPNAHPRDCGIL